MKRLLFLLLAASVAGIGTSCSKGDDAAPVPATAIGYTLDGRATTATGNASYQAGTNGSPDLLTLIIVSQPNGKDNEFVEAVFTKPAGTADTSYRALRLLVDGPGGVYYYPEQLAMSIARTSTGKYSGTFAGKRTNASGAIASTLASGIFTEVR